MELIDRFKDEKFKIDYLQRYKESEDTSDLRKYMEASCCFTGAFSGECRKEESNKIELDPRGKGAGAWISVFLALIFWPDKYFLRKTT